MDCVTIVSIIISGLLSLAISWLFFYFGNRNSLKITVICPVINLLENSPSRAGSEELNGLLSDYNCRYLHRKEMRVLRKLLQAYKDVSGYREDAVNASTLSSYFGFTLKKNKINPTPVPVRDDEGEIIFWDYPDGVNDLEYSISDVLSDIPPEVSPEECQKAVKQIFEVYAEDIYHAKNIDFFSDFPIEAVLSKSKTHKKWDDRFKEFAAAKEQFNRLRVVRKCK